MVRSIFCLGGLLFASGVLANGHVVPDSTHTYNISLDKTNIKNEKGYVTTPFTWNLNGQYAGTVTCPVKSIPKSPVYYRAVMSSGLQVLNDGYVKLNDFLDMKVDIWIHGDRQQYVTAPFSNESNHQYRYSCTKGYSTRINDFVSGSRGKVTFRVRKPIINGVQISDLQIVEMFGRLGGTVTDGFNNVAMSRIVIQSSILYVPEKCVINGGQTIEVEFGDLAGNSLDGINHEKTVPLNFKCEGGLFEGSALKINMAVSGKPSFDPAYLRTTRASANGSQEIKNLGIKFKQLNGSPLNLNTFYPVSMSGNIGSWGFTVAPVAPLGDDVAAGDFYATATIVAEFQ